SDKQIRLGREELAAVLAELAHAPRLTLHLAATGDGAPVLYLKGEGDARLFTLGEDLFEEAAALLSAPSPPKTCHDLKTHLTQLRRYRIDLQGVDFDTMLAGFLVNPGKSEPSLGDLYHQYLAPIAAGAPDTDNTGSELSWA